MTASGNILEQEQCVRLMLALYSCVKILYTLIPSTIQKFRLPLLFDLLKYQLAIVLKDLTSGKEQIVITLTYIEGDKIQILTPHFLRSMKKITFREQQLFS